MEILSGPDEPEERAKEDTINIESETMKSKNSEKDITILESNLDDIDQDEVIEAEELEETKFELKIEGISNSGEVTISYSKPVIPRTVINDLPQQIISVNYICH